MDNQHTRPPSVLRWFKLYCALLVVVYLLIGLLALTGFLIPPSDLDSDELPDWIFYLMVSVMARASWIFGAAFAAGILLRPKPWVWVFDLVLICIGSLSCVTLPASVPLLIYWFKPETKNHFSWTWHNASSDLG